MEHLTETAQKILDAIDRVERTQKWTATKAGIALTTFSRKLHGGGDFTLSEISRIAKVLGIHPADLLPDEFRVAAAA